MNIDKILPIKKEWLLFEAFIVWFAPGVEIFYKGVRALLRLYAQPQPVWWMVLCAMAVLVAFSFMFNGFVVRHSNRILGYTERKKSFLLVFDLPGWCILIFMMGLGITLGKIPGMPLAFFAAFYPGLGAALMVAGIRFLMRFIKFKRTPLMLIVLMGLILAGCNTAEPYQPKPGEDISIRGRVLSYEPIAEVSHDWVLKHVSDSIDRRWLRYGVRAYNMTYTTIFEGDPIVTNALVMEPIIDSTVNPLPEREYALYTHGTIFPVAGISDMLAPTGFNWTNASGGEEVLKCGLPIAASGRITLMPDYIGVGKTSYCEYPFIYFPELCFAILDGLQAFKQQMAVQDTMKLLIAGWSQGGGAALSTQYYLQRDYPADYYVRSTSTLAGLFHFSDLTRYVLEDTTGIVPISMLSTWAMYCVNRFGVHRPNDMIFAYEVQDQMTAILSVVGDVRSMFRPIFLKGILDGTDTEWINVAKGNDYYTGWTPTGKVFLHHGTRDMLVPYVNSLDAYEGLRAEGGDITLYSYEGSGHADRLFTFTNQTLLDWEKLDDAQ